MDYTGKGMYRRLMNLGAGITCMATFYPAPPGAYRFPFPHSFGSRRNDSNYSNEPLIGDTNGPMQWVPNQAIPHTGQGCVHGTPQKWMFGLTSPLSDPNDHCTTCGIVFDPGKWFERVFSLTLDSSKPLIPAPVITIDNALLSFAPVDEIGEGAFNTGFSSGYDITNLTL